MSAFVKSFSVGNGDMFKILDREQGGNVTVLDCCLAKEREVEILREIKREADQVRFISTHPDNDHIRGLAKLSDMIRAFWSCDCGLCLRDDNEDVLAYKKLVNPNLSITAGSFITYKDKPIGIDFLWPKTDNKEFRAAVEAAKNSAEYNNVSPIVVYTTASGCSFMWMGDMSSDFISKISNEVSWRHVDVIFAPHHGRERIPAEILTKVNPAFIVIGEAISSDLDYYKNYCDICQNTAGDILFECEEKQLHVYCSGSVSDKVTKKLQRRKERSQYAWYKGSIEIRV